MPVKERIIDQLKYGQTLFYLAFCLYLYKQGMETTMFPYNYVFAKYSQMIIILLLTIKIVLYDHCTVKQMALSTLMVALSVAVARSSTHTELVMWVLLVLGARNVPVEHILRLYLWITGAIVAIAFVASQLGVIVNLVYESEDGIRNAWGIVYPTDLAAHVFGLVTVWLYLHRKKIQTVEYVVLVIGTVIFFEFTRAKLDCICILLMVVLFYMIQRKEQKKRHIIENYKSIRKERKKIIAASIFPFFMVISVAVTLLYNSSFDYLLKNTPSLTTRFKLGKSGLQNMGVKLLGQSVSMIGFGGGTDTRPDYNFIDCSYLNILIQFGPLFLCMVLLVLAAVCLKYSRDKYMTAILFCWGLNAVIAHHLVEITYNPYPLLLLAGGAVQEDAKIASLLQKIRDRIGRWRKTVQQNPVHPEIQLLQAVGLLLIIVSGCLPELTVNDRYDTSRVFWKCLTANGAGVFLLASGMQLFYEKSWKAVWLRTLRTMIVPLWIVGMIGYFFSRWFVWGWDFWWSLWHVTADWVEFFKNLVLLRSPFYYMEHTGFLQVYFVWILLFPLWKKMIERIEKKQVYTYAVLGVGLLFFIVNDSLGNPVGLTDSGWKTLLPVAWLLYAGYQIEKNRKNLTQIKGRKVVGIILLMLYITISYGRCRLQCSSGYTERDIFSNIFSVAGIVSADILLLLFVMIQSIQKDNVRTAAGGIETLIIKDMYIVFLFQKMTAAGILRFVQDKLTVFFLVWKHGGAAGEVFYTGILLLMVYTTVKVICMTERKIRKTL